MLQLSPWRDLLEHIFFLFPPSGRKFACAVEWWASTVPHNMELRLKQICARNEGCNARHPNLKGIAFYSIIYIGYLHVTILPHFRVSSSWITTLLIEFGSWGIQTQNDKTHRTPKREKSIPVNELSYFSKHVNV